MYARDVIRRLLWWWPGLGMYDLCAGRREKSEVGMFPWGLDKYAAMDVRV